MLKRLGNIFIAAGISFAVYAIALYYIAPIPIQTGITLNIILFVIDCLWFLCLGIFFLVAGMASHRGRDPSVLIIRTAGYAFIFSFVFLLCTVVFNYLAKPILNSTGRIFTFILQSGSRLTNPSLSPDFLIPFGGIVLFIGIAIWFHRVLMERIKRELKNVGSSPG